MTSAEIRDRMTKLRALKDGCDVEIAQAKAAAQANGEYIAPEIWGSLLKRSKHYGREWQKLSIELGQAVKREKAEAHAKNQLEDLRFERQFMRIAKMLLQEDTYMMIMRETAEALKATD